MEAQKSSGFGCLHVLGITVVITIVAFATVVFLCWNVPVGKTDAGNQVIVGDYVMGPLLAFARGSGGSEPNAARSQRTNEEPPAREEIIDAEVFSSLKLDVTTYDLIRQYLGPGELVSANVVGDLNTAGYRWHNPDGSSALLVFQNGVLVSKSQDGLQ